MLSIVSELAPFISWMRGYRSRYLWADVVAGLTVAVVAVPQSMAYALVTISIGMPDLESKVDVGVSLRS